MCEGSASPHVDEDRAIALAERAHHLARARGAAETNAVNDSRRLRCLVARTDVCERTQPAVLAGFIEEQGRPSEGQQDEHGGVDAHALFDDGVGSVFPCPSGRSSGAL